MSVKRYNVLQAAITGIEYHLPERVLANADLAAEFPNWTVDRIAEKTGIEERRIAGEEECSSDLAAAAATKLFASGICSPCEIDYLLFCTQSPDYLLPTTACVLQSRLGLPTTAGALDINLGCSGFVYGLSLSKALVETAQARNVLLLTAETYSKFLHPHDKSVRCLFGDAGAATLVQGVPLGTSSLNPPIGPFDFGTDGRGAHNLILPNSGLRRQAASIHVDRGDEVPPFGGLSSHLQMNGPEIFSFTLQTIPTSVRRLLTKATMGLDEIDLFIFHQANKYMLDHLRRKIAISERKMFIGLRRSGNTVSCTIPIALKDAVVSGGVRQGQQVMLVGFGVGYSWASALIRWQV